MVFEQFFVPRYHKQIETDFFFLKPRSQLRLSSVVEEKATPLFVCVHPYEINVSLIYFYTHFHLIECKKQDKRV